MLETAEVIKRADLFIGIDSGPAHLANAVGTPGVIILGSFENFSRYTPYSGGYATGGNADLVRAPHGPAANVPVEAVFSAVMQRLRRRMVA
jgi:heptosyltransferase-3